ncbi:hypothetical protein [Limimaricola soesokkakensis]
MLAAIPDMPREITCGPVSFEIDGAGLRELRVGGHELIRGVAFLVRDRDWGTLAPEISDIEMHRAGDRLEYALTARYRSAGATLTARLRISAGPDGLDLRAEGRAEGQFETNRAGFTVLHPIAGQAGAPLRVTHADGRVEQTTFPDLIAPWQPVKEIAALRNSVGPWDCDCTLSGDVFEMEDQRQWGDASFKTYNRPLALPWPYVLAPGVMEPQAVSLRWHRRVEPVTPRRDASRMGARLMQTALVLTPEEALRAAQRSSDLDAVRPQRLLCSLDATLDDAAGAFAAFAALQVAAPNYVFDLELICGFDADPDAELVAHSATMRAVGFAPESVMVCASVDRQSTPPGSDWPDCPPLAEIHAAARAAFPKVTLGGGMASFFPELNRKRPAEDAWDFVTHGLCPIVHDARDAAVMQTLEAVGDITRSAEAIAGARGYRVGPCSIAMRQNPYGSRTIPNPGSERVCMTDDDPRHRTDFGAAYAVGLATRLATSRAEVWTPAALYGPRGLFDAAGRPLPITAALAALAGAAGQRVISAEIEAGLARLELERVAFTANLTPGRLAGLEAHGWMKEDRGPAAC